MQIKICGMRCTKNIADITGKQPDYLGFIFYEKSPRFAQADIANFVRSSVPNEIKKIGVFVNEVNEKISQRVTEFQLQGIQMHGDETIERCREIRKLFPNLLLSKAFGVDDKFCLSEVNAYATHCDYLLFDTKTKNYGGSGKTFSWNILRNYSLTVPFFLSGGIGLTNIDEVIRFSRDIPQLMGVDVNSKVELQPGVKNVKVVQEMIERVRNGTSCR
ncbi:phosphoribosylanthranilate isomerase [Candidatus Uabimicrobium sp. HlEnr_7]|uniref:phosphoribosylanthranilate isomerase n=1 Tax=Candidatus Uabimicrobium helgolandensis TaxID=3095367 RepID=UPI0035576BB8